MCSTDIPIRGKGAYFRLGNGPDVYVRKPQMVEGLRGKRLIHVAVGALHCLAVTENGQVRTLERGPLARTLPSTTHSTWGRGDLNRQRLNLFQTEKTCSTGGWGRFKPANNK